MAIPMLAVGRLDWAMDAPFGAFTSLYGRNHVHLSRVRMQFSVGLLLVFSPPWIGSASSSGARTCWSGP